MRRLWGCAVVVALLAASAADPTTGALLTLSRSGFRLSARGPGAAWSTDTFRATAPATDSVAAAGPDLLVGGLQTQTQSSSLSEIQQRLVFTRIVQATGQTIDRYATVTYTVA